MMIMHLIKTYLIKIYWLTNSFNRINHTYKGSWLKRIFCYSAPTSNLNQTCYYFSFINQYECNLQHWKLHNRIPEQHIITPEFFSLLVSISQAFQQTCKPNLFFYTTKLELKWIWHPIEDQMKRRESRTEFIEKM